MNFC